MIANVNQLIAFGKYQDGARSIVIPRKRDPGDTADRGLVKRPALTGLPAFAGNDSGVFPQATIMIRLRNMVREERPSWRSSLASDRRASAWPPIRS